VGIVLRQEDSVTIIELQKNDAYLKEIGSEYTSSHYYDVSVHDDKGFWKIELAREPFEKTLGKNYQGKLFEDHIEEPRVFAALRGDKQVGWLELGYDRWNNRMRVWEFLVDIELRKRGIGTLLMSHAVRIAKAKGARMLVLETQTNNDVAVKFYLDFGFKLIGLDIAAYSNEDLEKKEIRLELGLKL
jgi:ribosomal protein S18 acetylase RimI-like enzyme